MDRTIRLRLKPNTEQAQALAETTRQFTASFNAVCAQGWRLKNGNAFDLHKLTYRDCKTAYPKLVSDLHIQARQKASEAVKSALTRLRHGKKTGCPQSVCCPARFNLHTYTLDWQASTVRLSTTQGKQTIPFHLPPYAAYALGCSCATADLVCKRGKWYLHVVVENLTHIRSRVSASRGEARRRLHSWSFAQLRRFLAYKAQTLGCRVVGVDPRHTSQRCHVCGFIYRGNRKSQSEFQCRSCGHQDNADRNAAKNIRDRHLVGWANGPSDRLPSERLSSRPSVASLPVSGSKNPTDGKAVRDAG